MNTEERRYDTIRETDRWLRRTVVYLPLIALVTGWGSGVITTYLVFKDHERRIAVLEKGQIDVNTLIFNLIEKQGRILGLLEKKIEP